VFLSHLSFSPVTGHCVIWVQCSSPKCEKWRQLRGNIDPSVLPDDWSCDQNPGRKEWKWFSSSFYCSSVSFPTCLLSAKCSLVVAGVEGSCGLWEGRIFLFCVDESGIRWQEDMGWTGQLYVYTELIPPTSALPALISTAWNISAALCWTERDI
jgi:hypothetical protein